MRRWLLLLAGLFLATVVVWKTGVALLTVRAAQQSAVPAATASAGHIDSKALRGQILHDDQIDDDALHHIEERGNKLVTATAYFEAAEYEYENKRYDSSLTYLQRALEFAPNQAALHHLYAAILLEQGEYTQAMDEGGRAAELAPDSADIQRLLGIACYNARKLDKAVAAWERAQQLAPNDVIAQNLAKAKRELTVEGNFNELALGHFVLRYEGGKPAEALTTELLQTLERQYGDLRADFVSSPSMVIVVTLYSKQQFSEATLAPDWAGALNDGSLRIPVGDVTEVTPQLETVLKHELTHTFVHALDPNCPLWLNEGLAQLEEGKSASTFPPPVLKQLIKADAVALHDLEGSFTGLNAEQAKLAYAKSLAATEFLRDTYGMPGVHRLLTMLAEGKGTEPALRELTDDAYDGLERELRTYLTRLSPPSELHQAQAH
jgi:tetratricopeptide (TPR) repeat protein